MGHLFLNGTLILTYTLVSGYKHYRWLDPRGIIFLLAKYKISKTYPELDEMYLNTHMFGRWQRYWRPTILEEQQGICFMWDKAIYF